MDRIANFISILKTGQRARKDSVLAPSSKMVLGLLAIMKETGYVAEYEVEGDAVKKVKVTLKYAENGEPVIRDLVRLSRSSRRDYRGSKELPRVANGYGTVIVSTSKGLMTGKKAQEEHHGGEVICYLL